MYVKEDKTFDYDKLYEVTKIVTTNLNNIIDVNYYPNDKTRRSNYNHRPIGIGVQGLADVFFKMDLAFGSDEAKKVNKLIFETIYYAALERSNELSRDRLEGLKFLKEEYYLNNWGYEDDKPHSRNYSVYNVSDASSYNVENNDTKIKELLKLYKPIKAEMENLDNDYIGSYSSFVGSPISQFISI